MIKAVESSFPANKAAYNDLVKEEMKQLSKRTISHFKSLSYLQRRGEGGKSNGGTSSSGGTSSGGDAAQKQYGQIQYNELYDELFEDK